MHRAEHIDRLSFGLAGSFVASYYRARYYDSAIGRFLGEDPIGFGGDNTDRYTYVDNEPMGFIDPWGLQKQSTILGPHPFPRITGSDLNTFNNALAA
jgi:RHS repeat-associated protein